MLVRIRGPRRERKTIIAFSPRREAEQKLNCPPSPALRAPSPQWRDGISSKFFSSLPNRTPPIFLIQTSQPTYSGDCQTVVLSSTPLTCFQHLTPRFSKLTLVSIIYSNSIFGTSLALSMSMGRRFKWGMAAMAHTRSPCDGAKRQRRKNLPHDENSRIRRDTKSN